MRYGTIIQQTLVYVCTMNFPQPRDPIKIQNSLFIWNRRAIIPTLSRPPHRYVTSEQSVQRTQPDDHVQIRNDV